MMISKKEKRIGEERLNNQGCLMKIVEYIDCDNIVVEFQDEKAAKINSQYSHFLKGQIKNPYYPSVFGVGVIGVKYPVWADGKMIREYIMWRGMLERCFSERFKNKHQSYKDAICCDEWLLYESFYEWLHNQENFDKWNDGNRFALDKDILIKGNKFYYPKGCCLVPINVNSLFTKSNAIRGIEPIGVKKHGKKYQASCHNPFTNKMEFIGTYPTTEDTFIAYKNYKEDIIKQVAKEEYNKGNITKECYNAMMNYEVEIDD